MGGLRGVFGGFFVRVGGMDRVCVRYIGRRGLKHGCRCEFLDLGCFKQPASEAKIMWITFQMRKSSSFGLDHH